MLKHQELIYSLSLKDKLMLISSRDKLKQNYGPKVDLDSFVIEQDPTLSNESHLFTYFPSNKLLAATFDSALINRIFKLKTIESKDINKSVYFNVSTSLKNENISEDYLLSGLFLKEKINGIKSGNGTVNVEKTFEKSKLSFENEVRDNIYELMMSGETPDSLLIPSLADFLETKERYHYERLFYVTARSLDEAVQLINNGVTMIDVAFTNSDDEYISFIADKILNYRRILKDLKDGRISQGKFAQIISEGLVVNEDNINKAVDDVISLLEELKETSTNQNQETNKSIVQNNESAYFDEILHDNYAYVAAREGIVLLKNENNILPISHRNKIAVFGEYAKENKMQTEFFSNHLTKISNAFDAINDYDEINAVGFAYGYKDNQINELLLAPALNLATEADYLLVYLCAKENEKVLPEEQLELLRQLYEVNKNIIAVVSSDGVIDTSFDEYCKAILLTYRPGQEGVYATLDILIGDVNPSGKLVDSLPELLDNNSDSEYSLTYYNNQLPVRYCFGHGLSYSAVTYKNLEITEKGVTLTLTNESNLDGSFVPQLYIEKIDSQTSLSHRILKGFSRVNLLAHESKKVEISFNDFTFRYYDEEKQKFGIEGGKYEICVGESLNDIRLKGSIVLQPAIFNDEKFTSIEIASSNNIESIVESFVQADSNSDLYASIEKNERKNRKTAKTLLLIYGNILLVLISLFFRQTGSSLGFLIGCAILAAFNVTMIILLVLNKKNNKKVRKTSAESLTALVDKTKEFKQIAKVSYYNPIKPKEDDEVKEEKKIEEKVEEAEKQDNILNKRLDYDNSFNVVTQEIDEFANEPTAEELISNMIDFFKYNGISIDYASTRNIVASLAASKLLFLRSDNEELLPKFTSLLNRFFGNTTYTTALDFMARPFDLYWKEENGRFVLSPFVNTIKAASEYPSRMFIDVIDNVNMQKFEMYFEDILKHIVFPTENVRLILNDDLSLDIPDNVFFIIVPSHYSKLDNMSRALASVSQTVDITISTALEEEKDEITETNTSLLTLEHFNRLIKDGKKEHYIKEENYKELDEFEEIISKQDNFKIGNKIALSIENYVSIFMECGGNNDDAFIYSMMSKIVPLIKATKLYKDDASRANLLSILEKCFTTADLTKVKRVLRPYVDEAVKKEDEQ